MPVICLGLMSVAALARYARSAMLEVIQQDYIRTVWSKGLRKRADIIRHAFKNAFIPVVTMLGMRARMVFGGSIIVVLSVNLFGDGLRDALDPRLRGALYTRGAREIAL